MVREITKIKQDISVIPLGNLLTNCYIIEVGDGEVVLIDPGDESLFLNEQLKANNLKLLAILITHAHFDHVGAVNGLLEEYNCPVYMSEQDQIVLENIRGWSSYLIDEAVAFDNYIKINEGESIDIGNKSFKIIETPGHSPGGISFVVNKDIFVGDLIFASGGYGRYDLYGGSLDILMESIRNKVLLLDEECTLFPGHGGPTTIKQEKVYYEL